MEETKAFISTQITTIITLIVLAFSVLLTLISLLSAYKKALKQAANRIDGVQADMEKQLGNMEERHQCLLKKLSIEKTQRKFINLTSLSTQSWNENKICTHLKIEIEIVDLVVRNYDEFDDPSGIIFFKRYNLSNLLLDLSQNKYNISEDKTKIIDCRRTISRIMESIKSDKDLADKLNTLECLQDYNDLESAIDNVLINAQSPNPKFVLSNLDRIKEMAR